MDPSDKHWDDVRTGECAKRDSSGLRFTSPEGDDWDILTIKTYPQLLVLVADHDVCSGPPQCPQEPVNLVKERLNLNENRPQ